VATYVLEGKPPSPLRPPGGLGNAELIRSVQWYTKVRWIAAAVFSLVGLIFLPSFGVGNRIGILPITRPMWLLAAFLATANVPFRLAVTRTGNGLSPSAAKALLWGQILVDLVSVTYLVHVVGSVDTFIAFFYLLHITLSCIALSPAGSLGVACLAAALYLGTVALETTGVWPHHAVIAFRLAPVRESSTLSALFAVSAVFLWFVIWYFISTLSQSLRARERQVNEANQRLVAADEDKNRIMIQTTHDLKTPFFGIESNIQLLTEELGSEIQGSAARAVQRIRSQAGTLRARIDSILLYNELRSRARHDPEPPERSDVSEIVSQVVDEVRARAAERRVSIELDTVRIALRCRRRQLAVLLTNLVSNAVAYSHEGGHIEISVRDLPGEVRLAIADHGIGIRDDALPHIFDEYFRAKEAVRMNRISTGLGLAIVREIALRNSLKIVVTSAVGRGTTFEVIIPKEIDNAKDHDR